MQTTTEHYTSHKLSVFDPQKIEQHFYKNPTRALAIIEIVEKLIKQGFAPLEESRRALRRAQPAQAASSVNQLKNSLRNFGAMRVCDIATDIEHLLETRPQDSAMELLFGGLELELKQFFDSAQQWLEQQKSLWLQEKQFSMPDFDQGVQLWLSQLTESNMQALDTFADIEQELSDILPPECMQQIDKNLFIFNFECVLTILKEHKLSSAETPSTVG